jgi:hypothetical protein
MPSKDGNTVTISSQSGTIGANAIMPKNKDPKMLIDRHEEQRSRARAATLSRHYRSIGPAAILAALLFRKPAMADGGRSR